MKNKLDFRVGDKVFDILRQEKGIAEPYSEDGRIKVKYEDGTTKVYNKDGTTSLYEKHPVLLHYNEDYDYNIIDFNNLPQRQEPKRWRAKKGKYYYYIEMSVDLKSTDIFYGACIEKADGGKFDKNKYIKGNYFQTEEQSLEVADKMNAYFKEITSK